MQIVNDKTLKPIVTPFFDAPTNTFSYVVEDPTSGACGIVDSVLDFDYAAGRIGYASAERIIDFVRERQLTVEWIVETHVHADHLSAAPYLQAALGGKTGIGEHIHVVQQTFGKIFNEGTKFQRDGSQFDRLFSDGDRYEIGALSVLVLHTPGHTPACTTHLIGDAAFVGDTIFMPDAGSARADFPGGDAATLYASIQRVLSLPGETRLFMCHDYAPGGRELQFMSTVAEQRAANIHAGDGIDEETFTRLREERDRSLAMPRLIIPSLQVNMKAGELPAEDATGTRYLRVPLDVL